MKKINMFIISFFLCGVVSANDACKVPLTADALKLEGGFRVPRIIINSKGSRPWNLDLKPGTTKWVGAHTLESYVVEMSEPGALGDPNAPASTWPELTVGRTVEAFQGGVFKMSADGVLWLDNDNVLVSSRSSYRMVADKDDPPENDWVDGQQGRWITKVNIDTGAEIQYSVRQHEYVDRTTEIENFEDNFHLMQGAGGGFVRVQDTGWASTYIDGRSWLLGRGGYDVLLSPQGPAMAIWDEGAPTARLVIDFPQRDFPARRDTNYQYPSADPSTYDKVQLPIWTDIDEEGGNWQAGDVYGITHINHPHIKGFLAVAGQGRGILDYRAQGDCGSGRYFTVAQPSVFYATVEGCTGDRGSHQAETGNAIYADGTHASVAYVFDPTTVGQSALGKINPWEVSYDYWDWPESKTALTWRDVPDYNRSITQFGSIHWDDARQLLWVVIQETMGSATTEKYLHAYSLSDTRTPLVSGITIAHNN